MVGKNLKIGWMESLKSVNYNSTLHKIECLQVFF